MLRLLKSELKLIARTEVGMSIIEILIALTLLGIVGAFVASNVLESLEEGSIKAAKIQMQGFGKILLDYKRKCGRYPTGDQGLEALVAAPTSGRKCKNYPPSGFLQDGKIPLDPWDEEYIYESDGRKYTIISWGTDGEEGGEGNEADISSDEI